MTHDSICPQGGGASITTTDGLGDFPCLCDLIAKVRQDEEEKAREALEAQAKRIIRMAEVQAGVAAAFASDDMLDKCISAVESVGHWTDSDMGLPLTDGIDEMWITKGNAIAALRALEEKP